MTSTELIRFIADSNRIEGIEREPTVGEYNEAMRFLSLPVITVESLQNFLSVFEPEAKLREFFSMDVRVGNYVPPKGGPHIRRQLELLLEGLKNRSAHQNHLLYEQLHPFTDGNGRSGRMLWLWQVKMCPLGFLHHFYCQTLSAAQA